jgi:hypothetical protein
MKIIEENNILSYEEILQIPEMLEVYHFLENTQGPLFPKKYEMALKSVVSQNVYALFKENPSMPLKNVVSSILSGLSDEISSKLLLKMTQRIIKEWENLSCATLKSKAVMQLA